MRAVLAIACLASSLALAACASDGGGPPESMKNPPKLDQTPISAPKFGGGEEDAVLKAVDTYLLALGNGDRELQKTIEYSDGSLAISRITKDSPGTVRRVPSSELQKPTPNHDPFIEMYWSPTVLVRGPFAQVWAPYVLRNNGAVVHCGIDAFQLVKDAGVWKIHSGMSTMEPDACAEMKPEAATGLRPRDGWKETPNQ
jgi:hypothetical protein